MNKRIGYHVEEKFFGTKINQATAFAQYRANQFGRDVHIVLIGPTGHPMLSDTVVNPESDNRTYAQRQVA